MANIEKYDVCVLLDVESNRAKEFFEAGDVVLCIKKVSNEDQILIEGVASHGKDKGLVCAMLIDSVFLQKIGTLGNMTKKIDKRCYKNVFDVRFNAAGNLVIIDRTWKDGESCEKQAVVHVKDWMLRFLRCEMNKEVGRRVDILKREIERLERIPE